MYVCVCCMYLILFEISFFNNLLSILKQNLTNPKNQNIDREHIAFFATFLSFSVACTFVTLGVIGCPMPQRYVLTLMGFFGLVMAYSMRLSLSVAITQMVVPPITNVTNLTLAGDQPITICPVLDENYYNEHMDRQAIMDSHYNSVKKNGYHFIWIFGGGFFFSWVCSVFQISLLFCCLFSSLFLTHSAAINAKI